MTADTRRLARLFAYGTLAPCARVAITVTTARGARLAADTYVLADPS